MSFEQRWAACPRVDPDGQEWALLARICALGSGESHHVEVRSAELAATSTTVVTTEDRDAGTSRS